MIWATVSSQSCFCWLYRSSPSLAAKNIINLISVLTIWWCPCVEPSCVVGRGCLLWPVRSFGKTLLAFALLHFVLQGQICLLLQASLPRISQVAQTAKCLPTMRETWVQSLGWEDLLEKEMATHSSVLAWKIPWTEEPGRLQSMRLQRVGHDWMTSLSLFSAI